MGSPTRLARWGEEEPQHEVKAYLPDMPTEYSERRRPDVAISTLTYALFEMTIHNKG